MPAIPVIAIFDIGKTNKKLFLFNENYKIVFEHSAQLDETVDEDGFPCENVDSLNEFVLDTLNKIFSNKFFEIRAINFSAYGASFVHVSENGKPVAPLYNYLKPYPNGLKQQFYDTYGGEKLFSNLTASPVLGHLNSGMQLYWLKYQKPEVFETIKYSLHLPQYLSLLISKKFFTDLTSIGCHTNLWNYKTNNYHQWVHKEGIIKKLPPIVPSDLMVPVDVSGVNVNVGVGLHDSSAALIPYLVSFHEPFILISTGTWCISLNPFNTQPLTTEELECDCLSYLTYQGQIVKASRLFAGNEHEQQVKKIADYFSKPPSFYKKIEYDREVVAALQTKDNGGININDTKKLLQDFLFESRDLSAFSTAEEAYHQLMLDIVRQQFASTQLVLKGTQVKRLFVDGGFSKNVIYMNLLASSFPQIEVFAASVAQATAMGAALAVHPFWNQKSLPNNIIELKYFSAVSPVL